MFDFDRVIERRGTHASKWDNMAKLSGITAPDAIPMWVADMDFAAPPGVTEALAAETGAASTATTPTPAPGRARSPTGWRAGTTSRSTRPG